jgi:hypothetical protein
MRHRLAWAEQFERRLAGPHRGLRGERGRAGAARLAQTRAPVRHLVDQIAARLASAGAVDGLMRLQQRAGGAARAWDEAMAQTAQEVVFAPELGNWIGPADLSTPFFRPVATVTDPFGGHCLCAHCGALTRRTTLAAGAIGLTDRWHVHCDLCGPLSDRPAGSAATEVRARVPSAPPRWFELAVDRPAAAAEPAEWVFGVIDRTKPRPCLYGRFTLAGAGPGDWQRHRLPDDSGYDVYVVRGLVICQMEVEYVGRSIAVTP